MSSAGKRPPVASMWWAAGAAAVASALVWGLWVLPVAASVREATPVETGQTVTVPAGEDVVGIWASGRAAIIGTLSCTVDGAAAVAWSGPSLEWDDTLWWVPGRSGFAPELQVRLDPDTRHEVVCEDGLGFFEAEWLVARDAFGTSSLGLGRTGSADYPMGTILAVIAVMAPLFVIVFPLVAAINAVRRRASRPQTTTF